MKITTIINEEFANTYLIENNNEIIIVDCGASVEEIKTHLSNKTVKAILITHSHFDHIKYLSEYIKEFSCDVYCSKNAFTKFNDSKLNLSQMFSSNVKEIKSDNIILVNNLQTLHLIALDIEVYSLTGHSNCSLGYKIDKNMFSGDILFDNRMIGRTDFYDGSDLELRQSLKVIKSLGQLTIYPGHGNSFDK